MNLQISRIVENYNRNYREVSWTFQQLAKESHMPLILLYRVV